MARDVIPALEVKELHIGGHASGSDIGLRIRSLQPNGAANVTISNVAPAGVGTATISAWLSIDVAGTTYFIPCWT